MSDKDSILKLLDDYFKTRKNQFDQSQFEDISVLTDTNMLKLTDGKQVKINFNSIEFNEIFLEYIENNQEQKIPQKIKKAFDLIDKFEKQKKSEYGYSNILNAYSDLVDGLKSYIFYLFHTKEIVNVIDFFRALNKKEQHDYDKYLFETILLIEIDKEVLYQILSLLKSNDMITRVPDFCSELGRIKPQLAHELYNYALQNNDKNDVYILSYLLIGLFESDTDKSFALAKDLLKINSSIAYFTIGRLKYKQEKHIRECFEIIEKIDKSDIESLQQVPYIYKSLIENSDTPPEIREKCFSKMQELFLIENEQLRNAIFMDCQFIQGYEEERYKLLFDFLSKSQNYFNRINNYFRNFTNPDYFFHLFVILYDSHYKNKGKMIDVSIFSEILSHFWKKDKSKTEHNILSLLTHEIPHVRIGAVDLIRSSSRKHYDIDLLSIETELQQLRALEALLFSSYYNIEKLLPLILSFRKSTYKNVVLYLQEKLCELIIHSYHSYLYDEIIKLTDDKDFLSPITEAMDYYLELRKNKLAIDDLNPCKNEHTLMNLYYALEREENRKIIQKTRNTDNSFLSTIKQTIIVRGNAWKVRDNSISPLGSVGHSFAMDLNMYKNPDLFDFTHNTFNSEF